MTILLFAIERNNVRESFTFELAWPMISPSIIRLIWFIYKIISQIFFN